MAVEEVTIGQCRLICGDAREVLPTLEGIDAIVTDPPYGLGVSYGSYMDTRANLLRLAPVWLGAARSLTPHVVFTPGVANLWVYPEPLWTLCWAISGAGACGKWGFNCWQPILCYGPDPYLAAGRGRRPDLIFINEVSEKNGHPCPKPLGFVKRLIDRVTLPGWSVCDPFMGSGTTGVACVQAQRSFVGIEIEPRYFDMTCQRIEEAYQQLTLFPVVPRRVEPHQASLFAAVGGR